MASDSIHDPDEGRGAGARAPEHPVSDSPETGTAHESGTSPADEAQTGAEAGAVDDAELIEMLEQLSETIDTAQHVLNEQNILPPQADSPAAAGQEQPAPVTHAKPPDESFALVPFLAASMGVCFAAGALAVSWFFWNAPDTVTGPLHVKDQSRVSETAVARSTTTGAPAPAGQPGSKSPETPPSAERPADKPPGDDAASVVEKHVPPDADPPPMSAQADARRDKTALAPAVQQPALEDTTATLPKFAEGEEAQIMQRGETLNRSGDIAGARLAFEYAALRGSADGMYALGRTYDPELLAASGAIGIEPDIRAALEWYGRAAELGHDAADARAHELEQQLER